MTNQNIGFLIYIIASLIAITILSYLYIAKKPSSDPFCSCRNMTNKICPDPKVLTKLYNSGKLTEFTNFAKIQSDNKDNWKVPMPEDECALNNYQ
jgi:hypothetical protein